MLQIDTVYLYYYALVDHMCIHTKQNQFRGIPHVQSTLLRHRVLLHPWQPSHQTKIHHRAGKDRSYGESKP